MNESNPPIVTKSRLMHDLEALGVQQGDVVMLHASVKAAGHVVGGPDVILQALLDLLTPAGTLMMLVGWEAAPYEMAGWPEAQQRAYLEECPPYDPDRSPAVRAWSILAEYLRTWPGACRSDHPDSSFAAVGGRAGWITAEHSLQYGHGPGSPLAKLYEAGGKVLLLGATFDSITLLHYAEHLAQVPDKPVVRYKMPVLRDGHRVWVDIEEYDTNKLIGGESERDYFQAIPTEFLASGQGRSGKVGAAQSYLLDARALVDFAVRWLERTFGGDSEA
jgi:aminoglycoside 3-N-acetyltransferase